MIHEINCRRRKSKGRLGFLFVFVLFSFFPFLCFKESNFNHRSLVHVAVIYLRHIAQKFKGTNFVFEIIFSSFSFPDEQKQMLQFLLVFY
jgi:hypothetical protein